LSDVIILGNTDSFLKTPLINITYKLVVYLVSRFLFYVLHHLLWSHICRISLDVNIIQLREKHDSFNWIQSLSAAASFHTKTESSHQNLLLI